MSYRYGLDTSSKKFNCPQCGKKSFVRVKDNLMHCYLPDNVGRCDREVKCGYEFTFKQYYGDSQPILTDLEKKKLKESVVKSQNTRISKSYFENTLRRYDENHFLQWCSSFIPSTRLRQLIYRFAIGTHYKWEGSTVFWQIDQKGEIRAGKIMDYCKNSGKRVKKPYNRIDWVHSHLIRKKKIKDFDLQQCLFGIHQLNYEVKNVKVVESEKTAFLMSFFQPRYVWLATGGLQNINKNLFSAIRGREIEFWPDNGAYDKWCEKIEKAKIKATVSKVMESVGDDGDDIADFYLSQINQDE